MYTSFQLAKKYLQYYLTAQSGKGHGIHSPFVFGFVLDVLRNRQGFHPPEALEALRKQLLQDKALLHIEDLGAGSRSGAYKNRTVQSVVATAVKPRKWSHFLYRLVKTYNPQTIIELGTSLGLSTAHMATANPAATVYTIEGSRAVYEKAKEHFSALKLQNIKASNGAFDDALPPLLTTIPFVDLAFIDGNHRYKPTMHYFNQLLQKAHPGSIFLVDDIHWSAGMEAAWAQIKAHPQVRCTIDLFFTGLVFFRPEFHFKQHFVIRF